VPWALVWGQGPPWALQPQGPARPRVQEQGRRELWAPVAAAAEKQPGEETPQAGGWEGTGAEAGGCTGGGKTQHSHFSTSQPRFTRTHGTTAIAGDRHVAGVHLGGAGGGGMPVTISGLMQDSSLHGAGMGALASRNG
jgi:hypothetical protein